MVRIVGDENEKLLPGNILKIIRRGILGYFVSDNPLITAQRLVRVPITPTLQEYAAQGLLIYRRSYVATAHYDDIAVS